MIQDPPDITQAGFLALMDDVLRTLPAQAPFLCGSIPCPSVRGEPPEKIVPQGRLTVQLEGRDRVAISVRGKRQDVELTPGRCIYLCPHSWSIPFYDTKGEAFSVVVHPKYIRFVQVILTGQLPPSQEWATPWAYHTSSRLSEPGMLVMQALNRFTEEGYSGPATADLTRAFLQIARRQLAEDVPQNRSHIRAMRTWYQVRIYLETHFGPEVSRKSVAAMFDLHPNYLSALARKTGGQSFRHVLESVRMLHARRLLRDTDLKLSQIASECGYSHPNAMAAVFQRTTGISPARFRAESRKTT